MFEGESEDTCSSFGAWWRPVPGDAGHSGARRQSQQSWRPITAYREEIEGPRGSFYGAEGACDDCVTRAGF
eukprot:1434177-Pyramimonas_sp.AAC.1